MNEKNNCEVFEKAQAEKLAVEDDALEKVSGGGCGAHSVIDEEDGHHYRGITPCLQNQPDEPARVCPPVS